MLNAKCLMVNAGSLVNTLTKDSSVNNVSSFSTLHSPFSILFFFLLLNSSLLTAQPVTISGHADTYKGKNIAAYTYKDFITMTPQMIGSTKVNDTGYFSITLPNIKTTQYIYLNIENLKGSIYVTPGTTYKVIFPPPDSIHYQNPFITHDVDLVFQALGAKDVNSMVIDYNEQWDLFWRKYYTYFVRKEATAVLDSFHLTMNQRYVDVKNDYFWAYLNYTLAETEINILVGQKTLANKYLKGKPVLYHNYEYMKFFNDYFKDFLEQYALSRESDGNEVNKFIGMRDYPNLMEVMKINPLLRSSDSLCELVLIKGLYEMYYSGDYTPENIKSILTTISLNSKIEESRTIARDMLETFSDVSTGAKAPEFTLKDITGEDNNIVDFRGKYLYIGFFKGSITECMSELEVISALRRQYGKKINFVCISEDDNIADLKKFLDDNKIFNWVFLYDDGHKVMNQYEVKILPEFFLIDPKGNFFRSPADAPSHGIQTTFDQVLAHSKSKP